VSDPHVSFLIPAYNYARYLPDCLNSIFAQAGSVAYEIVIVNDASTDDTRELLARLSDPRVRVLHNQTNQGHARTIEIAIRAARGELIARIDPDDRYRPDFLQLTTPIFLRYPDVGLVYGDAAIIDDVGRITTASCDMMHGGSVFHGNELVALLQDNFICAPTVIARRECWLDALPVPAHLAFNDWYFTVMIARKWNFYFVPSVLAEYRVHGTQHHTRVARDGSEEKSVRWLLDQVYAQPETDASIEQAKQRARGRILASHLVGAAEKYFWFGNYDEARRCYLEAMRADPRQVMKPHILRHLVATWLGKDRYERLKHVLRGGRAA
jgi:glycosyltransferase involved in cell wall biosynthesis